MIPTLLLFAILGPKPVCVNHPTAPGEKWCTLKLRKAPTDPAGESFEVTTDRGKFEVKILQGQTSVGWPIPKGTAIKSLKSKKK